MATPKAEDFYSDAIIGEIRHKGTIYFLIDLMRGGNAHILNQDAWNVIADFLEEKQLRRAGRPESDDFLRDKEIVAKFKELRKQGMKQEDAYHATAKELASNYSTIKKVVNADRSKTKRILAMQNDPERFLQNKD